MSRSSPPRLLALALLLVSGVGLRAQGMFQLALGDHQLFFFEPVLSEQEGHFDAHLDASSPDLEFEDLEGAGLGATYGASVFTAGEGIRARWDRYILRGHLAPGPIKLGGGPLPLRLGFGLRAGAELRFLRHFPTGAEAVRTLPPAPWVVASTDALLENLRPGDMATMPVHGQLLLSAGVKTPIVGIPAKAGLFARLGGTFQASVLRLRGEKVRVRFLSLQNKAAGVTFKTGLIWDLELLEVFGERLKVLAELNLAKAMWFREHGEGVLLDATLDLADPAARRAFEMLLYRPLRLVGPKERLLTVGWSLVQELAADQEHLEPEERSVLMNRCGLLDYRQRGFKVKLGNSLLRWGRKDLTTRLEYDPHPQDGPTISMVSNLTAAKRTVWFRRASKWFAESRVFATREGERLELGLWTLRYRVKDRRFTPRDLRHLRRMLVGNLGPALTPELPDMPEDAEPGWGKSDVRIRLGRAALEELAAIPEEELAARFDAFTRDELGLGVLWRQGHAFGLISLPRELHDLLDKVVHDPDDEALLDLARLRETNSAFGSVGPAFLLHLLRPREDDARLSVYFRYKNALTGKHKQTWGAVEAAPAESLKPIMRFLESGILELQTEAAQEAAAAWAERDERGERFQALHGE